MLHFLGSPNGKPGIGTHLEIAGTSTSRRIRDRQPKTVEPLSVATSWACPVLSGQIAEGGDGGKAWNTKPYDKFTIFSRLCRRTSGRSASSLGLAALYLFESVEIR